MSQYLRYCLEQGLIRVVAVRKGRGRYPSRDYDLSERGRRLLGIFEEPRALESPRVIKHWETCRVQP